MYHVLNRLIKTDQLILQSFISINEIDFQTLKCALLLFVTISLDFIFIMRPNVKLDVFLLGLYL